MPMDGRSNRGQWTMDGHGGWPWHTTEILERQWTTIEDCLGRWQMAINQRESAKVHPQGAIHYAPRVVHRPLGAIQCPWGHSPSALRGRPPSAVCLKPSTIRGAIRCQLKAIHCPLEAVHCKGPSFVLRRPLAVCRPLATVRHPLKAFHCSPSALSHLPFGPPPSTFTRSKRLF